MIKRIFDIVLASIAIIALAPLLVALYLLVRVVDRAPVLFVQQRPGLRGRPFSLVKFRTMTVAADGDIDPAADGDRLTPLGRWLRRTSLDELPELWNVLTGDMSLVGPRPLLMGYLPLYTKQQARRHEVRPGITGVAQISGRNALSWEERFRLDVWYVDHCSLWLDLKVLLATVAMVVRGNGISQPNHPTMERFRGSHH